MIQVIDLNAYYGYIHALKGVSVSFPEGKIVTILGANGAGKSTFLKCVSGIITKKTGKILYRGEELSRFSPQAIVAKGISQVPEGRQLFDHLTVLDNLQLGAYLLRQRKNQASVKSRMESVHAIFPILDSRSRQLAGTLSGGEKQMLAIARALMAAPKALLLDEPSMGLAPLIVREIFSVIQKLNVGGTCIALVEQNAREALKIAHSAYVFETGSVALQGEAQDLLHDPKVIQAYLGGN